MTNFIKEQQQEAFIGFTGELTLEEFDSLIYQVVQNTVKEIERRVESMRKEKEVLKDGYIVPSMADENYNQALTDVQSLLKDISKGA